jgi:hypothetical protein
VLQSEHGLVGFEPTGVPWWLQHKIYIFNKCEVFQKYLSQREFLKGKGRIFWNILFGNGILEIN